MPMTPDYPIEEVERIEALIDGYLNIQVPDGAWVKYALRAAAMAVITDRRATIDALQAKLQEEGSQAAARISDLAFRLGTAEGKLELSENYAVLDSWMQKCAGVQSKLIVAITALEEIERRSGTDRGPNWAATRAVDALIEIGAVKNPENMGQDAGNG